VGAPRAVSVMNVPFEYADVASAPRASREHRRKGYCRCTVSASKERSSDLFEQRQGGRFLPLAVRDRLGSSRPKAAGGGFLVDWLVHLRRDHSLER